MAETLSETTARSLDEWHEDDGPALWWKFPIDEPPYVGTPNDFGHEILITIATAMGDENISRFVAGWPGYHTHWTPIPIPKSPAE